MGLDLGYHGIKENECYHGMVDNQIVWIRKQCAVYEHEGQAFLVEVYIHKTMYMV